MFAFYQFDKDFTLSDIFIVQRSEDQATTKELLKGKIGEPVNFGDTEGEKIMLNKKFPFDLFLLKYVY